MLEMKLTFYICPIFLKQFCQNNLVFGHNRTKFKNFENFQTISEKIFEKIPVSRSLLLPKLDVAQRQQILQC